MQKTLLFIFLFILSVSSFAQCTADYDFGDGVDFGVSPNPSQGESFDDGVVGQSYEDIIHMLVPTDAGDINEAFTGYIIDSLELTGVSVQVGTENLPISDIGLSVICNNNGDSSNPCLFLGGNQYCAAISGAPTQSGDFPLTINVMGYLMVLGSPQAIPYFFDQYTLHISENEPVSISENSNLPILDLEQNIPNPFSDKTVIKFVTKYAGNVEFVVRNLLGEVIFKDQISSKTGTNSYIFNAQELNSGIYMYSMDINGTKITKRMVINK